MRVTLTPLIPHCPLIPESDLQELQTQAGRKSVYLNSLQQSYSLRYEASAVSRSSVNVVFLNVARPWNADHHPDSPPTPLHNIGGAIGLVQPYFQFSFLNYGAHLLV